MSFYRAKTLSRIAQFYEKKRIHDSETVVNGVLTPRLSEMLNKVDWEMLSVGTPSGFHGDLQFDNVVVPKNPADGEFVLLDWRQEFAGIIEYGDLYYDFGKLYYAVNISHEAINNNLYSVERVGEKINIDFYTKYSISSCKSAYEKFLLSRGYSLNKVRLIYALILLNMSPLHHAPFDELLYYLGKLELYLSLYQKV